MKLLVVLSCILFFVSCSRSHNNKETKIENYNSLENFDFLTDCDSLEIWQGGIQGLRYSKQSGIFIMAQCSSNKDFDLIVYSDRQIELEEASDYKAGIIKKGIDDAEYYAFEIPKKKPDKPENEFDTFDYIFPCEVRVFKLVDQEWKIINSERVETFQQLGELKQKTINQ
jgi:hypothetical protein